MEALVAGANGSREAMVDAKPGPEATVTDQYMCFTMSGAMPDQVPAGGFIKISWIAGRAALQRRVRSEQQNVGPAAVIQE